MKSDMPEPVRALSLLSGGLDSRLAVAVLREQGIEVHGVVFDSPFFETTAAEQASKTLGIPLHVVGFTSDILELLDGPKHGFGSCMNPCMDCHARMLRRTGEMAEREGFQVIATGEVLNQRPMSQNRRSLGIVAEESGYADIIVRPLSAKCLPETRPEKEGWVDRSRLLGISGRGRKPQLAMARERGWTDFPSPAGGCRLTEPNFCMRLRDLQDHEGLSVPAIELLRAGRHFRLGPGVKLVLGRNEKDNAIVEAAAGPDDLVLELEGAPGPTGLLPSTAEEMSILLAAAICARYADWPEDDMARVRLRTSSGSRVVETMPASAEKVQEYIVGRVPTKA